MNKNQTKLLEVIQQKGALLDANEIVQFYAENVQRRTCRIGVFESPKDATEYNWQTIRDQARSFYLNAIGRFIVDGYWHVSI